MSFGFITFGGKLPRGAFGYFIFFLLNMGFNVIFTWNCLKLEVNPTTKETPFFKPCIQVIYLYFKDLPSWVVIFSSWQQLMVGVILLFLYLWILPFLDLSLEPVD